MSALGDDRASWSLPLQLHDRGLDELVRRGPLSRDARTDAWIVTSAALSLRILSDDATFTSDVRFRSGSSAFWVGRHPVVLAGAEHRRLHSAWLRIFNSRSVRDSVEETIRPVVEAAAARSAVGEPVDLAAQFADAVSLEIGLTILGGTLADPEQRALLDGHRPARERWKDGMVSGAGVDESSAVAAAGREAVAGMAEVFRRAAGSVRSTDAPPAEGLSDVLGRLEAVGRAAFSDWSDDDTVASCWSIFDGGETRFFLRNLFYYLALRPDLAEALRADSSLIQPFVDEALRYIGPTWYTTKRVTKPTVLEGHELGAGETVHVMLGAANRDPDWWTNPNEFDLERTDEKKHLAFGQGVRYCVGRHLATAVAVEAVRALLGATRRLDVEAATPPAWAGDHTRSVSPLLVRCAPSP